MSLALNSPKGSDCMRSFFILGCAVMVLAPFRAALAESGNQEFFHKKLEFELRDPKYATPPSETNPGFILAHPQQTGKTIRDAEALLADPNASASRIVLPVC